MEVATLNTLSYAIQNVKLGTPVKSADPSSISKVRLIVRVRSFLPQEIVAKEGNPKSCVSVLDQNLGSSSEVSVHIKDPDTSRNESYQLDSFFGQEDDNISHIFYREVNPLIPGVFHGCNATVFAYGATGSGKTYTMQGTDEHPGLMPRTMSTVLSMCKMTGSTAEISYYEVYMDRCYDLLEVKAKEIAILDDKDGQIHLKGLSRVPVQSMSEFNEVLSCGVQRRKVAQTGLNDVSSRSHGVLVITVSTPCSDDSGAVVTGKMNLIDLAGNEDNRRTCNEGIRLQESAKINQSLFALSNVIYALNNNKPRIPYRESKLTRILQDSLGGTNRALMVACLNPGEYQESVYTVSLAARSRQISNYISSSQKVATPTVKVTMEAKLQAWLESKGKSKSAQRGRAFGSPFPGKTPSSVSPVKKSNCNNPAKAKPHSNAKLRSICLPSSNLFNNEITVASKLEDLPLAAGSNGEEVNADTTGLLFESPTYLQEEPLNKQGKMKSTNSVIFVGSPPINGSENELESPSREALSPINLNINQETPKTPSFATCANDPHMICTPFDKYNAWSSNLKSSVIQQYIHFLNTASREELLEIKGIGLKMAEYILELRETSPLRSLSDLEKIGLSSKQVHNMFSRAAKGIF